MRILLALCLCIAACKKDSTPPPPTAAAGAVEKPVVAEPAKAVEEPEPEPAPGKPEVEPEDGTQEAIAEAGEDESDTDCNIEAFVIDPDPAGLNVRESPTAKSAIVGGVRFNELGTVVTVVGSENGWLLITGAEPTDEEPYEIRGWVSGQMVGTSLRCPDDEPGPDCMVSLHAERDTSSAVVRKLPLDETVRVVGCKGKWVEAQTMKGAKAERAKGWLEPDAQCPNPLTSCS